MRIGLKAGYGSCALLALLATACSKMPAPFEVKDQSPRSDRDAPFDPPAMYPGWAYDQPSYVKPPEPLTPEPRVKEGDPLHYFTNKKLVMIRQPSGYTPEEIPRVAIWWTDNNGFHWHKGGYFGRQQSFFPFEVEEDGDYGIRFVGPGQNAAVHTLPEPERVYHVDTVEPEVEVTIEPEQSWYTPGQTITIAWRAEDYHLEEFPVRVTMLSDFTADEPREIELQRDLADEGVITFEIPPEMLDHEIRFRVDALDRANNLGIAFSYPLQIVEETVIEDLQQGDSTDDIGEPEVAEATGQGNEPVALTAGTSEEEDPPASDETIMAEPFPTATAREPADDTNLVWDGPTPASFPNGDATPMERSGGALHNAGDVVTSPTQTDPVQPMTNITEPADSGQGPAAESQKDVWLRRPGGVDTGETPVPQAPSQGAKIRNVGSAVPAEAGQGPAAESQEDVWLRRPDCDLTGSGAVPQIPSHDVPLTAFDPTAGNGLLVPLPATVEQQVRSARGITAHPWRLLGRKWSSPLETVWALPRPRFGFEPYPLYPRQFLADSALWRPVGEPAQVDRTYAGLPTDDIEADATIAP